MAANKRELRDVLKSELAFLEVGGYRHPDRAAWRPHLIFEDSPTCLNFGNAGERKPCSECVLMELVPPESQGKRIPCRHIPLNQKGETLDSIYRWATQEEVETAVAGWLKSTIQRLEHGQSQLESGSAGKESQKKTASKFE